MGAPPRKPQADVKPQTPRRVGRAAERAAAIAEERRQAALKPAPDGSGNVKTRMR
jgi:hypothetical protein